MLNILLAVIAALAVIAIRAVHQKTVAVALAVLIVGVAGWQAKRGNDSAQEAKTASESVQEHLKNQEKILKELVEQRRISPEDAQRLRRVFVKEPISESITPTEHLELKVIRKGEKSQ